MPSLAEDGNRAQREEKTPRGGAGGRPLEVILKHRIPLKGTACAPFGIRGFEAVF